MHKTPRNFGYSTAIALLLATMAVSAAASSIFITGNNHTGEPESRYYKRIVSVSLATDEILMSLVDPSRILALTYLADYENVSNVAEQAGKIRLRVTEDPELIVSLRPDIVLVTTFSDPEFVRFIKNCGLNVLICNPSNSIENIKQTISLIGRTLKAESRANELIKWMDRQINVPLPQKKPLILYYSHGGITSGLNTVVNDIITLAGCRNIAALHGVSGHRKLSLEQVLISNPEHIITGMGSYESLLSHPALQHTTAVREKNIHHITDKYLSTVSQYCVLGIKEIRSAIHQHE